MQKYQKAVNEMVEEYDLEDNFKPLFLNKAKNDRLLEKVKIKKQIEEEKKNI
jgi:hypothetical protein